MDKYLVYVFPLEDIKNKDNVLCDVQYLTGDKRGIIEKFCLSTSMFEYYFYGMTFEVAEFKNNSLLEIRDVNSEDMKDFDMYIGHAVMYNNSTSDFIGSDGNMYNLDSSVWGSNCTDTLNNVKKLIEVSDKFVMYYYRYNGEIIAVLFENNESRLKNKSKDVIYKGFVTNNIDTLKNVINDDKIGNIQDNRVLKQPEIDRLVSSLRVRLLE